VAQAGLSLQASKSEICAGVIFLADSRKLRDLDEATLTIMMASDLGLDPADVSADGNGADGNGAASADSGAPDPMSMVELLPEISVPVNSLVPGFHLRLTGTDAAHVRLLADAAGAVQLPPVLVQKRGARIIDGMHRVEAAKLRGEWAINARVVDCTDEEALVLAVKSNTLHGLPLTRADRISSAKRILATHSNWSDRKVAVITGLSAKSIASLRNNSVIDAQFHGKRLGRDGKLRPVVAADGRRRAVEYITAHPEASLREVARETDVSVGTVHDVREKMRRGVYQDMAEPRRGEQQSTYGSAQEDATGSHPALTSIYGSAKTESSQRLAWQAISAKLTGDPALRYTDGGRAFLRWMAQHAMQADEWREFADAIPQRWLKDVWQLAATMSDEWREFAEQLRYRHDPAS
jgi:ParB-like chromosome segregation protein Spo0J